LRKTVSEYESTDQKIAMRQAIIYRGEDGFWVAECPSLPGCISQGETRDEAVKNIREAIQLHIETLEEDGLDVPDDLASDYSAGGYVC
jgi:predicted RNase H-like HicB family nuclease